MAEHSKTAGESCVGICKLCLVTGTLRKSHLMPKGLYGYCRTSDCEPVFIGTDVMMPTSRQTKDNLLCGGCEALLNQKGENWVLPKLATIEGAFPFYGLLQQQQPVFVEQDVAAYAISNNPAINRQALIQFALGIFWKASVHPWSRARTRPRIDLGLQSEDLRRFLRGEGGFPQNLALNLEVTPSPVGAICFTHPVVRGANPEMFFFYVPGMMFTLWRGRLAAELRTACLVSNDSGPVVVVDTTPRVMQLLKVNAKTARKSEQMREIVRERESDGQRRFKL